MNYMRIILLFLVIPISTMGQTFFAEAEVTYSTYSMNDLKSFQNYLVNSSGITLKSLASYPPYFGFGGRFGINNQSISYGLILNYNSTGARAYYEDYSGTAKIDQLLKCYSAGLFIKSKINKSEKWPMYISFSASWVHTLLNLSSEVTLGTQSESSHVDFYSNNYGFRPSFVFQRVVKNNLYIEANAGYELQVLGKLSESGGNGYLNNIKADWSGLRFALGVGIFLNRTQDKE